MSKKPSILSDEEQLLNALLELHYDECTDIEMRIQTALKLMNAHLGTLFAIVSHVEGNDYTIVYCDAPADTIVPNQQFPLDETYCTHTLAARAPTSFHHAGKSRIATHPCYQNFQLEAYLGAPIKAKGSIVGTVNFSSPEPRNEPFSSYDEAAIATLAVWIGKLVEKEHVSLR